MTMPALQLSRFACCWIALALGACASSPPRFHTLIAPASAPASPGTAYAITVLPVSVPPQVDVPQLVLRSGASGIQLAESEHWIAPLPDELRGAFAALLSAQLNVADVSKLEAAPVLPVYRIRIDVRRFESQLGRWVLIDAGWTVQKAGADTPALVCSSAVRLPVTGGFSALVQGHQQALARIAGDIAATLRTDGGPPALTGCPARSSADE
jgi:uncharacterized protein